jgi:hypothetical protein
MDTLAILSELARIDRLYAKANPPTSDMIEAAKTIAKASRTLTREAVKNCNGIERFDAKIGQRTATWTDADQKRSDAAWDKAEAAVDAAIRSVFPAATGVIVEFQPDPRGAHIQIFHKDAGHTPVAYF